MKIVVDAMGGDYAPPREYWRAHGFITTDIMNKLPQKGRDTILSRIPLKRFGTPYDVAELVPFLVSERAGYITAQVICIDGGVI